MIADNTTKTITMFRGETGTLTMAIDGAELDPEVDRVIFTASKDDNGKKPFFSKVLIPSVSEGLYAVTVVFKVGDTKDITPGNYFYELELGIVPDEDESDMIVDVDYDNGGAHRIARPIGAECYKFVVLPTPAQIGVRGLQNV